MAEVCDAESDKEADALSEAEAHKASENADEAASCIAQMQFPFSKVSHQPLTVFRKAQGWGKAWKVVPS